MKSDGGSRARDITAVLAQLCLNTGQMEEAEECFRQALSLAEAAALPAKERGEVRKRALR